jgi:DNA-directed RNA polymerase subunit RPC12/RpoP
MPIIFRCSQCQRKMSTAEAHAGRRVRCPDCSTVVIVPDVSEEPAAPPPARRPTPATQPSFEVSSGRAAPPPPASGSPFDFGGPAAAPGGFVWAAAEAPAIRGTRLPKGWRMVRMGINLVYWGAVGCIAAAVLRFVLLLLLLSRVLSPENAALLQYIPLGVFVLASIPIVVGQFLWLAAPEEVSVKWLALASGICTVLCVTAPAGFIIWLLALRGVAVFFNQQRLARQVVVFLIACVLAVVGFCPAMIVVTFLVQASPAVGQVVGMIAVITSVVLTFWYLALLGAVRTTIDRARTGRLSY